MNEALIAVDIGTTNIETILCGRDRSIIDYRSVRNEQRRYGSDVASRICAAAAGPVIRDGGQERGKVRAVPEG